MEANKQSTMLIGSPNRGVYVPKKRVEQLPKNTPKGFALKLFELVFSRDEAKTGSMQGKGEKLLKLDPKRIAAVKEYTELTFSGNENVEWATIKKCIDEKLTGMTGVLCGRKKVITSLLKLRLTKRTIVLLLKAFKGLILLITLPMCSSLFEQNNLNVTIIIQVWFKQ